MCGRYTIEMDEQEVRDIIEEVERKRSAPVKTGEIFPTNAAPVLVGDEERTVPELMVWGFPNFRTKGVIINARAETAREKRMFQKSLETRRCVVVSSGFYEWTQTGEKQKYRFRLPGSGALYMAGLYNTFQQEERYVILTTAANDSMRGIHHRMPVVLPKGSIESWLFQPEETQAFLQLSGPALEKLLIS